MKFKNALSEMIRGNSPIIVLTLLEHTRMHGYGLAQEIERRSEGKIHLGEATIYPLLRSLEQEGFVSGTWEMSPIAGVRCRLYELTPSGRQELANRRRAFDEFQATMLMLVGGKPDVSAT